MYSLPHSPNLARCTQAAGRAPKIRPYRTSSATTKEYYHIMRWFLDGKEPLRREHLQNELRREVGRDREDIGKD